jgi:DNA-binding NarL/FixJ family response regulator
MTELQEKLRDTPDAIVILDYSLFDFSSMQQMLIVKAASPKSTWLLFSDEDIDDFFLRYVTATDPTISIVLKSDSRDEIAAAIDNAKYDIPYYSETVEHIIDSESAAEDTIDNPINLTASEKVILHEIAKGKTTKEIAYDKNLSFHTVNSHRKNIFRKLGVNNLHEAIKYAIRAGIFDVAEYYI